MFKTFGFYAQDDYRATSRVTLTLGCVMSFKPYLTNCTAGVP